MACWKGALEKNPPGLRAAGEPLETWQETERSAVVGALAVGADVQAFALVFFADAQADDQVNQFVGDVGDHSRLTK